MSGIFYTVFILCFPWTSTYEFNTFRKDQVKICEGPVTIPTCLIGEPESNAVFYTSLNFQEDQLPVYPHAYLNNLTEERVDEEYNGLFIENKYIKIHVLPELGERLYYAMDKANQYDFIGRKFRNGRNNGDTRLWDLILTDEGDPCLELKRGKYPDNQLGYSWHDPQGIRSGTMYCMPIRNLNSIKNANKEMAFNLVPQPDLLGVKLFVDHKLPLKKILKNDNTSLH